MQKLVQVCLCDEFNPKFGYQHNILPFFYNALGYSCVTITSQYVSERGVVSRHIGEEKVYDGIRIIRLPARFHLPYWINKKLRWCSGLYRVLRREAPDVLFLHGCQFFSLPAVIRYARKHPEVRVYCDNHDDYINSMRRFYSKLLHRWLWRGLVKRLIPLVRVFWGVTEQRCHFLRDVYGIPEEKISLLIMGADTRCIPADRSGVRRAVRERLGIGEDDFVLVSGGKLDRKKNMLPLLEAAKELNVKMILFGWVEKDFTADFKKFEQDQFLHFLDWIDADSVYELFLASDLAVFPGTHSVLWEQAAGCGIPLLTRRWEGMTHVDAGGNCAFLQMGSHDEIKSVLSRLIGRGEDYQKMLVAAKEHASVFSYERIAAKSIEHGDDLRGAENRQIEK